MMIGQDVKRVREEKKLTRAALGKLVGVSGQYIGMIESGKREPALKLLIAIARAMGYGLNVRITQ